MKSIDGREHTFWPRDHGPFDFVVRDFANSLVETVILPAVQKFLRCILVDNFRGLAFL